MFISTLRKHRELMMSFCHFDQDSVILPSLRVDVSVQVSCLCSNSLEACWPRGSLPQKNWPHSKIGGRGWVDSNAY